MKNNRIRRRVRKRKSPREKTKMKFTSVLVIIFITIALGYATASFIIAPLLGYNADESPININSADKTEEQKDEKVDSQDVIDGYALQFGVFSTKEAAQKLVTSLSEKGIEAKIIEADNKYKVISPIIQTKDEALGKLEEIKDKDVKDVFIASF